MKHGEGSGSFESRLEAQRNEADRIHKHITNRLLEYYKHRTEQDKKYSSHVLTWAEASQIVGVPIKELRNLMLRAFRTSSLNDVLEGIGLPHKPRGF